MLQILPSILLTFIDRANEHLYFINTLSIDTPLFVYIYYHRKVMLNYLTSDIMFIYTTIKIQLDSDTVTSAQRSIDR